MPRNRLLGGSVPQDEEALREEHPSRNSTSGPVDEGSDHREAPKGPEDLPRREAGGQGPPRERRQPRPPRRRYRAGHPRLLLRPRQPPDGLRCGRRRGGGEGHRGVRLVNGAGPLGVPAGGKLVLAFQRGGADDGPPGGGGEGQVGGAPNGARRGA